MLQERWQQAQLTAIPPTWQPVGLRLPARKRTRFVLRPHGQRDWIVDRAEPIVQGTSEAVDAIATDDGQPIAIVTLESNDAARLRPLEPVLALFAEKLGAALARLRASQNEEFLRRYLQEMFEHARGPIIAIAPDRLRAAGAAPLLWPGDEDRVREAIEQGMSTVEAFRAFGVM